MTGVTISRYEEASATLRHADLAQSLYDEGAVIMADVLLVLHGDAHRARRTLEFRVFRRDFFRYYETEIFPRTLAETLRPYDDSGRADLTELGYRVTMNLTADFAGVDRPLRTPDETASLLRLVMIFSEGATLVHSTRDKEEVRAEVRVALAYGATANLFTDRHGEYIGYGPEAPELVGIPEPDTFAQLPWDSKVARVWCTLFRNREEQEAPGSYLSADCRGNLKRIQAEFEAATGLHLRAGTEPEMMWLNMKEDGTPDVSGVTKPYCYHIDQFSELQPIIHKVIEYGQALGLDMIQGDHEDAPGQIELNFNFDRAEQTNTIQRKNQISVDIRPI